MQQSVHYNHNMPPSDLLTYLLTFYFFDFSTFPLFLGFVLYLLFVCDFFTFSLFSY